jgi:hypothetical protein
MRIQKKIQYYSNEEYRLNKIKEVNEYNQSHKENYNEYQRIYQFNKTKTKTIFI